MKWLVKGPVCPGERTAAGVAVVAGIALGALLLASGCGKTASTGTPAALASTSNAAQSEATIELSSNQLNSVKIEAVGTHLFPVDKEAVGNINFDDDLSVQVFPNYQGKLLKTYVELGDDVQKGQSLYTIDSPDLVNAESALIGAAATFELTTKELARAKNLYATNGVSERELEQATADHQTAEGTLKAARDALRVFGKTEAEIDQIVASRKIDSALVVPSPIAGRITFMNAPPGLLVQPGNPPAPYSVADLSTKWMVANAIESDSPFLRVGQPVQARVMAFPGRSFDGRISRLGAAVDPNTHRIMVRCDIADPKDQLRPGMLATFVIRVQDPVESVAIPVTGVVRNGDGTMAAWVTADRRKFLQRILKIGLQEDGHYQVLDGLHKGELAVTDGAIFLSNMLEAPPTD
jgi:cobalt-zinc-cadmium efflux system membrane fusion protein